MCPWSLKLFYSYFSLCIGSCVCFICFLYFLLFYRSIFSTLLTSTVLYFPHFPQQTVFSTLLHFPSNLTTTSHITPPTTSPITSYHLPLPTNLHTSTEDMGSMSCLLYCRVSDIIKRIPLFPEPVLHAHHCFTVLFVTN